MLDPTHTRLPDPGTPPAMAAARLSALIDHAVSHPQQAPRSATILVFRRPGWAMGLATAGLAAALVLAVMPGTFDHLARRSTVATAGLGQTAESAALANGHDDLADIDDMLTLNTLDSFGAPDDAAPTDDGTGI